MSYCFPFPVEALRLAFVAPAEALQNADFLMRHCPLSCLQPLGKGLLHRLLLNLCAHSKTRTAMLRQLLTILRPKDEKTAPDLESMPERLFGAQSNVVYARADATTDGRSAVRSGFVLDDCCICGSRTASVCFGCCKSLFACFRIPDQCEQLLLPVVEVYFHLARLSKQGYSAKLLDRRLLQ